MATMLINIDPSNDKIIAALVEKLGGNVMRLSKSDLEDTFFGTMINDSKTGKTVSKKAIMKKLRKK
jgi:hypothetical protein